MIQTRNLTKHYGKVKAVAGIDLSVDKGEMFGFLGPNGAGKTTTIKMLTGLAKPTAGTALVAGFDIISHPEAAKARFGYIADRPFLYEKLTAREFLEFLVQVHKLDPAPARKRYLDMVDFFSLTDWIDELVGNFSHGMKQKLVFIGALLHQPPVIIIDEPMVGLDPRSTRLVKELLKEKCAEGKTIFLSTHTLSVAQDLCARIGIIQDGKLRALGDFDELQSLAHSGGDLEDVFLKLTEEQESMEPPASGLV